MQDRDQHFLSGDARLRLRDEGTGAPVVLIHGWTLDLEAWERSLDSVAERRPARLCLPHFGVVEEPAQHVERTREIYRRKREVLLPALARKGIRVAGSEARSSRSSSEEVSVAAPNPATRTGCGREVRITAAAPSQIGEQSLRRSGVATGRFFDSSK